MKNAKPSKLTLNKTTVKLLKAKTGVQTGLGVGPVRPPTLTPAVCPHVSLL
jgi:hypothetical protein